MVWV